MNIDGHFSRERNIAKLELALATSAWTSHLSLLLGFYCSNQVIWSLLISKERECVSSREGRCRNRKQDTWWTGYSVLPEAIIVALTRHDGSSWGVMSETNAQL